MPWRNYEAAKFLETIAKLLIINGDDPYRIRAFMNAALSLRFMQSDVGDLHRSGRLEAVPGIGAGIAARLGEYLDTGRSSYLEDLKRQSPVAAADLLEVPGIGPVRVAQLYDYLGITTIAELDEAARAGRLRLVPGIGKRLEEIIGQGAAGILRRRRIWRSGAA